MVLFDQTSGVFSITDLGRIAAKYYIRHASIEIFNEKFRPKMTEADVLAMLSMSTEVSVSSINVNPDEETTRSVYSSIKFKFENRKPKNSSS
jgi:antiviral helicase SLH1